MMQTYNLTKMQALNFEIVSNTYFNATADNQSLEEFSDSDQMSSYDSDKGVNREGKIRKLNAGQALNKNMYNY